MGFWGFGDSDIPQPTVGLLHFCLKSIGPPVRGLLVMSLIIQGVRDVRLSRYYHPTPPNDPLRLRPATPHECGASRHVGVHSTHAHTHIYAAQLWRVMSCMHVSHTPKQKNDEGPETKQFVECFWSLRDWCFATLWVKLK